MMESNTPDGSRTSPSSKFRFPIGLIVVPIGFALFSAAIKYYDASKEPKNSSVPDYNALAKARSNTTVDPPKVTIETFNEFANNYALVEKQLFVETMGAGARVDTSVARTDFKNTDSALNPQVYEAVISTRVLRSSDQAVIWELENRNQFVYRSGLWEPVLSSVKWVQDATNSGKPIGVESAAPLDSPKELSRLAQGLAAH